MTPRQFSFMVKRHERRTKQEDRRAGAVIAALYNIHTRGSDSDPLQGWQDFFPEWREEPREQTEEEMIEVMRALMAATNQQGLSS